MDHHKSSEALNRPESITRKSIKSSESAWGLHCQDESGLSSPSSYDDDRDAAFRRHEHSPQPPRATAPMPRHHVIRFWPWELASLGVAVGLMIAMIVILSHYDGQTVPEWPFSINLNSLIALLSTIYRASMLVVVAEIISQVKWHWFDRPRPLHDLQGFDQASRSVIGSMKLLLIAPTNMLASLSAFIIVVSLAIGPFTQQAIKTVTCRQEVMGANASIPVANFVPGSSSYYRVDAGTWDIDVDMKGTMINGLTNPKGNDTAIHPTCQTGNCTFPVQDGITHSSIGMCSACADTTSLVKFSGDSWLNYTLPNAQWISPTAGQAWLSVGSDNMTWAESLWTPEMIASAPSATVNVTLLTFTVGTCDNTTDTLICAKNVTGYVGVSDYLATTCSLYPCLKDYNAIMRGGILSEDVVSTVPVSPGDSDAVYFISSNYTALKDPCSVGGQIYDTSNYSTLPEETLVTSVLNGVNVTAPSDCFYGISWIYAQALNRYMAGTLFSGTCSYDSRQAGNIWCYDSWWLSPLYSQRAATFGSISRAMDQFTTALTNKFRTTGRDNSGSQTLPIATGKVYETTVCTAFDWRWLILPIMLVVASGALLAVMIAKNYADPRQPVWKSSVLPLLFYGFSHPQQGPRPVMELDKLQEDSRRGKVRFQNGMDAGFVDVTAVPAHTTRERGYGLDSLLAHR